MRWMFVLLIFLFPTGCKESEGDSESKSAYGMNRAEESEGEFPHLKQMAEIINKVGDGKVATIEESDYSQDLIDQIIWYFDDQIIRLDELQAAFIEAEEGDPVNFKALLELESREMVDIYLALTTSEDELNYFVPESNDMLATFFLTIRQSGQGSVLKGDFGDLTLATESEMEKERIALYNALAKEHFADNDYSIVKDCEAFYARTKELRDYTEKLVLYFHNLFDGEKGEFPAPPANYAQMKGKAITFLNWIRGVTFDDSEDLFESPQMLAQLEAELTELEGEGEEPEESFNLVLSSSPIILEHRDGYRKTRAKKPMVATLQANLVKVGYNFLKINGRYNNAVALAVRLDQKKYGISGKGKQVTQDYFDKVKARADKVVVPAMLDHNSTSDPKEVFPVKGITNLGEIKTWTRSFGFVRSLTRLHAGVDIYGSCANKQDVVSMVKGEVLSVSDFYGQTHQVTIKHENYTVRYGELDPASIQAANISVGTKVKAGQKIGTLGQLIINGRVHKTCMLHVEIYEKGTGVNPKLSAKGSGRPSSTDNVSFQRVNKLRNPYKKVQALFQKSINSRR